MAPGILATSVQQKVVYVAYMYHEGHVSTEVDALGVVCTDHDCTIREDSESVRHR